MKDRHNSNEITSAIAIVLSILWCTGCNDQVVDAQEPEMEITGGNLWFGSQPVGCPSDPLAFEIANPGVGTLEFNVFVIDSDQLSFVFAGDSVDGDHSLAPGEHVEFEVAFHPTVAGPSTGKITITPDADVGTAQYVDLSGNGTGDLDGDGLAEDCGDCDDSSAESYPGAEEVCDGLDNDCDSALGDDEDDADGDGWMVCEGDCDDADASLNLNDADGDGLDTCAGDCDDTDASLNLNDTDGDGLDSCSGDCDDTDAEMNLDDGDGDGYSTCAGDCDDDDAAQNLDDADGDGWSTCDNDCDDDEGLAFPGNTEIECDGIDNDCFASTEDDPDWDGDGDTVCEDCDDGDASLNRADLDGDGYSTCTGDCDDAEALRYPGATEQCDGLDNDCDGGMEAGEIDADGDGVLVCAGDCDDTDASVYPNAVEACDGIDNDCDGAAGNDEVDDDGDGWMTCGGDCDDADPLIHEGMAEDCVNGIDDDCNGTADYNDTDTCVIFAPDVVRIDDADAAQLIVADDQITMPNGLVAISVGDVLVSQYGNGFLRRATAITIGASQTYIDTEQATLEDLYESAEIRFTEEVTGPPPPYVPMNGYPDWADYDFSGEVLYDGTVSGVPLTVELSEAYLQFGPILEGYIRLGWFTLEEAWFYMGAWAAAGIEITATLGGQVSYSDEVTILQGSGTPIPLGATGLVIVPSLEISVGYEVDATAMATVVGGASAESEITAGAYWDGSGWGLWQGESFVFELYGPDFDAEVNASIRGYLRFEMDFQLYDVAGPYFAIEPYAQLDLELLPDCNWSLDAGVDGHVGVEVDVLGWSLYDSGDLTVFGVSTNLGTGDCGCGDYYPDSDGDGYGDMYANATFSCFGLPGWVLNGDDCDDGSALVNPLAFESCADGVDNDCDGLTDGLDGDCYQPPATCANGLDDDGDGWADLADPGCANDPDGANEGGYGAYGCNDNADNDGDGWFDSEDPDCANGYDSEGLPPAAACENEADDDGDGWVDLDDPGCAGNPGGNDEGGLSGLECNDGADNDGDDDIDADDIDCADGYGSEGEVDQDGDGYTPGQGDCDDGDAAIHPGAYDDPCDAIDQDCADGPAEPQSQVDYDCWNGDVYWYDECGDREGLKQECPGLPCADGECPDCNEGDPCCPGETCNGDLVCMNNTQTCEVDNTPTHKSWRFILDCWSNHWQGGTSGECYPGDYPTEGCGACAASLVNPGCGNTTCWDREGTGFWLYSADPGYGSFSEILHCFENDGNVYFLDAGNCPTDPDGDVIGWIADTPTGFWDNPVYLCQWDNGQAIEQFFSLSNTECAGVGGTLVGGGEYGYAVP